MILQNPVYREIKAIAEQYGFRFEGYFPPEPQRLRGPTDRYVRPENHRNPKLFLDIFSDQFGRQGKINIDIYVESPKSTVHVIAGRKYTPAEDEYFSMLQNYTGPIVCESLDDAIERIIKWGEREGLRVGQFPEPTP